MSSRTFLLLFIFLLLIRCASKDCGSIDLNLLSDIKFQESIKTHSVKLEEFPVELDVHLNKTHKLILRCRSEDDLLRDRVLPGLMLWISDGWGLQNDTSKLGRIFHEHKIDRWERARVASILYHRYITDKELNLDSLLADASIRSAWSGRIKDEKMLHQFSAAERETLQAQIKKTDSLALFTAKAELALTPAEQRKKPIEQILNKKNAALRSLDAIIRDLQDNLPYEKDEQAVSDSTFRGEMIDFRLRPIASKIILIEQLKHTAMEREIAALPKREKIGAGK